MKATSLSRQKFYREYLKSNTRINVKIKKSTKAPMESGLIRKYWSTKDILKFLFILLCWGFCCYQTIDIFDKYASYPMDVNVIVEEMKVLQLPGITICNNNILYRKYLLEKVYPDLIEKNISLKELFHLAFDYLNNSRLSEIIELSQNYGHNNDSFIDDMECDSQVDPSDPDSYTKRKKKCKDREVIQSLQRNGVCFTFFHQKAEYKRIDRDKCKVLGVCESKEPIFDANEIARFELNFRPEEYTSNELPISGRISIHDNSEIGDSLSNAYNLEPGYYYQFFIKVQSTSMLSKPYGTNCINYLEKNSLQLNSSYDYTTASLSRKECSLLCTSMQTLKKCFCWPPELPYVKTNEIDVNKSEIWCKWKFDMEKFGHSYGACFGKEKRIRCSVKCQPSCWADHYEITVQKLSFEYYGRDDWNSNNQAKKNCCSVVSIRYWSTERTIHKYSPLFTILDMVCYVGGLVSMYTGLSLVAVYHYMSIIFFFAKKYV